MGDFGEPGGALESLERMAFGAEEIRLTTPEKKGEGVPMKVELRIIGAQGPNRDDSYQRLRDAICRYACDQGYKTFFQGESGMVLRRGEFHMHQRVLYLEQSPASDVVKELREFGENLDAVLAEMQKRGLVREIVRE